MCSKEVKLNAAIRVWLLLDRIGLVFLEEEEEETTEISLYELTEEGSYVLTIRCTVNNQGEKPYEKPALLAPWSWTSTLQTCEKISFCHQATQSEIVLWRPELPNAGADSLKQGVCRRRKGREPENGLGFLLPAPYGWIVSICESQESGTARHWFLRFSVSEVLNTGQGLPLISWGLSREMGKGSNDLGWPLQVISL